MELEADILHIGRGHQYCILVKYELLIPSIGDSRVEKPRNFIIETLLNSGLDALFLIKMMDFDPSLEFLSTISHSWECRLTSGLL